MKKILWSMVAIILACMSLGYAAIKLDQPSIKTKKQNLIIYNWGDDLDPKLIKQFEKKY